MSGIQRPPDGGNLHAATVKGFGDEWNRLDQTGIPTDEYHSLFHRYFSIFPWDALPPHAVGFDLGCGSGRWAKLVAPRVAHLHCIDPSSALDVARQNLSGASNCSFHRTSVDGMPLSESSMDFGYSLGVLHHVPDTQAGLSACVRKLKPGAPFLLYLYYAFDNRPFWYRWLWRFSDALRQSISRLPPTLRYLVTQVIAVTVYFPLARIARAAEKLGVNVANFPLSGYRRCSLYTMRTDSLDRFGTQLEKRFTKSQIQTMMENAQFTRIHFSETEPYWCAVGFRSLDAQ